MDMLNENNRNMNIQYATLSKTGKRSNNEDAFNVSIRRNAPFTL